MEQTPEFQTWFEGSQIVDPAGKPLRVYHGTTAEFDTFDLKALGSNTSADNTALGFFFIADQQLALDFVLSTGGREPRVIEAYLSIKKPLQLMTASLFNCAQQAPTLYEIFTGERLEAELALECINEEIGLGEINEIAEALSAPHAKLIMVRDGFDGVISHFGAGHKEYVAFSPDQIRVIRADRRLRHTLS